MLGPGQFSPHAWSPHRPARALSGPLLLLACVALLLLAGCGGHASAGPSLPILRLPAPLAGYHIFVSDLQTGDVAELGTRTTHVSESVHGLGLSADGHTLYVTDISGDRLVAFTLKQGDLTTTAHSAPVGVSPVHMVNTLDGRAALVTNFGVNTVTVVNTATWTPEATLTVGMRPHGIVLSPD
ncbi:MAG: YncE family protein, partial [Ktedonobacterales bacterium]